MAVSRQEEIAIGYIKADSHSGSLWMSLLNQGNVQLEEPLEADYTWSENTLGYFYLN